MISNLLSSSVNYIEFLFIMPWGQTHLNHWILAEYVEVVFAQIFAGISRGWGEDLGGFFGSRSN